MHGTLWKSSSKPNLPSEYNLLTVPSKIDFSSEPNDSIYPLGCAGGFFGDQPGMGTSSTATATATGSSRRRCWRSGRQVTATTWWRPFGWTCTPSSWAPVGSEWGIPSAPVLPCSSAPTTNHLIRSTNSVLYPLRCTSPPSSAIFVVPCSFCSSFCTNARTKNSRKNA